MLNISETSISRKVRLLEQHYDVPLFVRGHRSVTLTPQGHSLLAPVQQAMNQLRDVSQDMLSKHQRNTVTVSATNSVAALWIVPRLARFNQTNPRIRITLIASDDDAECLADTVDLAILRGEGHWPCFEARQLFGETVFPVCSPDYLATHPGLDSAEILPVMTLSRFRTSIRNG
ncbi:LysR substrate-binding domain-containing protein [Roseovarius sp. C7]|uniref:LysR substrate-binding domain-containing protein n=1 Tax=Roseovarius sp. C7 TaxID=3398643 RepID=UPI0039F55D00